MSHFCAVKLYLLCPSCGSDDIMKNGTTRRGKQNYKCRDCGRQFVENPQWKPIDPDRKAMIDRLLLEKLPLAGIARVMEVSEDWLQGYVNAWRSCCVATPLQVKPKTQGQLAVQMDELWSRVDDKGNKQWVWLAQDVTTREIVGCYIGDRCGDAARVLWASLPPVYRQCGVIYTDYWQAYETALREQTSSSRRQGEWIDQLHRTIQ